MKQLEYINVHAEDKRELRINIKNKLFNLFCSYEFREIKRIIEYDNYIKNSNNLLIDFEKWGSETKSLFIKSLSEIQPQIILKYLKTSKNFENRP
ncbi:hypothetical protein MBBAR_1c02840 [Methanobrevibacter arboriphilus JCM 13429 = DSM 1125]|uniref:Uncharacterized protein n=1 Tax=Methanobrevibacter arboriphilus JCM 13429 = DSM 1125 TaxID=1300164 RepID=A0A1V6N5C7_METAZ|nr:hypothetical protein [Methanobrevibacter arboriphilus]OQD59874.1 hypothetical protein MBBAR_1c02840 [Methanobrevibacter arboriphilus JCM 13429 = DSM 1125]